MYVIKRTDKEYGDPYVTHDMIEEAIIEAERLAIKHVSDNPIFMIYELKRVKRISSKILITKR